MADMWRTRMRTAMINESPREITEVLDAAKHLADGGEGVKAERRLLEERLNMLTKKAAQELRSLGRSKDFKAVQEAIEKYDPAIYPEETQQHWDVLQKHMDDLVGVTKARLGQLVMVQDPVLLGRELQTYAAYEKYAGDEMRDIRERYENLLKQARQAMQILVQRPDSTIVQMQETLTKYDKYPDDVAAAREDLKRRLDGQVSEATADLATLRGSDDVEKLDAALAKYSGTGEVLRQDVEEVSKRRQLLASGMRDELKKALTGEDPAKLAELVEKAKPYGADLARWSSAVEDRRATVLQGARDAMATAMRSGDFQACVTARDKYKGYSPETEPMHQQLVARTDGILDAAQDALRDLVSEVDPAKVQTQLEKFVHFGDAVKFEVEAVKNRLEVIFREAKAVLELEAQKDGTSIVEMDRVLQKYRDYPDEVSNEREQLATKLQQSVREATDELVQLRQGSDVAEIEGKLAEYQKIGGEKLAAPLNDLKEHRLVLYTAIRDRLRAAMSLESPKEIDEVLEAAKAYNLDEIGTEVRALERRRGQAGKAVLREFQRLKRSSDYGEVSAMLERYETTCPEELTEDYKALRQQEMTLRERAKDKLTAAAAATHPSEIEALLQKYETYGKHLTGELAAAKERRVELVGQANQALLDACNDPEVNLKKLEAVLDKYSTYPLSDIRKNRDAVKTKQAVMANKARESLNAAAASQNAKEIEALLKEYADAGEIVKQAYTGLRKHFDMLKETMKRKLGAAVGMADPKRIQATLDEAEDFGSSVHREVVFLKDRLASLSTSAISDMNALVSSSDYRMISDAVKKYEQYPDDTSTAWEALQKRKDDVVEEAKNKLLELVSAENPRDIDKAVGAFDIYGDELDDARHTVSERRMQLTQAATKELEDALSDEAVTVPRVNELLKLYKEYPDDIERQRSALRDRKTTMVSQAEERIKSALSGSDVESVDRCMKELEEDYKDELGALLKRLSGHRAYLQDTIFDKVKGAIHYRKPADIQAVLAEAQPFLTDGVTAEAADKLRAHLEEIKTQATEKLKEALEQDETEVLEAIAQEYGAFAEDAEVGAVLKSVRDKLAEQQQKVRDDIRDAIAEADPVKMKALMQAAEKHKQAVQHELPALQRKLSSVVVEVNKELQGLMRGSDIQAIQAALDKYKDYPEEFGSSREALENHVDRIVENAKTRLLALCASSDPREIEVDLAKYESYGEDLSSERQAAKERLADIVESANQAMQSASENEEATVEEMEAVLQRFAEFPAESVQDARDSLISRVQTVTSSTRDELRKLTVSQDVTEVDAGLEKHASAGKNFADLLNDLKEHRRTLLNGARDKMKDGLLSTSPSEIEGLIESTKIFGKEVHAESKALQRRRTKVIQEAIRNIQGLQHSDNYAAVVKCIEDHAEFAMETKSYVALLEQHRDKLLLKVKDMLKQVCSSTVTDPNEITRVMDMVGGEFEELVQQEKEEAKARLTQILDEARDKLSTMATGEDTNLREIEEVLKAHEGFPREVQRDRDALRTKFVIQSTKAAEEISAGLKLNDVTQVDELLEKFRDSGSRTVDAFADLKKHRARLQDHMGEALRDALSLDDPLRMDKLLKDSEGYGKDLHGPRRAVERRKASAIKSIKKEMVILQQSTDYAIVVQCLESHRALEEHDEIKAEVEEDLSQLKKRQEELLASAQEKLSELAKSEDPAEIDEGVKALAAYGEDVKAGREECMARRHELINEARAAMELMINAPDADTSLQEVAEKLAQYESFPDDLQKVRRKLHRKFQNSVRDTERKIRGAMAHRDPQQVDEMLQQYEKEKEHAGEAYLELERHRKRLRDGLVEQMRSLALSKDTSRIAATLERAEAFPAEEIQDEKAQLEAHQTAVVDEIKAELRSLASSSDFKAIEACVEKRKGGGEATQSEYDELVKRRDELVETCKAELAKLKEETDPSVIADGLAEWEPYANAAREPREDARLRRVELLDIAREEITAAIHGRDSTVLLMDETIQKFAEYPSDVQAVLTQLKDKLALFVQEGEAECTKAASTTDFGLICNLIDKYGGDDDSTGDHLTYAVDTLKAQRTSLIDIMAAKLEDVGSITDPDHVRRMIAEAEPYEIAEELKDKIESAKARLSELQTEAKQKLEDTLQSEDVLAVIQALDAAKPFKTDPALAEELRKAQQHLKELQQQLRQRLRDAHNAQTPDEIDLVLDDAGKYGDEVKSDVRALAAKRKALLQGASSEMKQLARTSDFAAIKAALTKYQAFPEQVKAALDALTDRYEDMLEDAKEQLRELATEVDPHQIDTVIARFEVYEELVEAERKAALDRKDQLVADAKQKVSSADGTIAEMQAVFDQYSEFPDVQEERSQLKSRLDAKVNETHETLRAALSSRKIEDINAAVELRKDCGTHLDTTFTRLEKQQRSMMDAMRSKMKSALASNNTMTIADTLEESATYGEGMLRWRRALEQRKETTIRTLVAELDILKASNDSQTVSVALEKFEKYGERFEEAKPAIEALREHHKGLVDDAKLRLKELMERTDIDAIQSELPRYDMYGTALSEERQAVQERVKTLLAESRAELAAALEGELTIGEMDRIVNKFEGFPSETQLLRKKLRDKMTGDVRAASQKLKRALRLTDAKAIDEVVTTYEDSGEHLVSVKEMVRRHRQQLQSSMFFQMKNAMAWENLDEIDKIIEQSEGFGDAASAERDELKQRKVFIVEEVISRIKTLLESTDIEEVEAALKKYSKHATQSDDIRTQYELLNGLKEKLVGEAKQELQRLAEVEDPREIEDGVAKLVAFGSHVEHDREAALTKLTSILDRGTDDIEELLADETKSIAEMSELVTKYATYGESFAGSLERLKAKRDLAIQTAAETLERAAQSSNVREIEQALAAHGESSGDVLATLVSAVQKQRDELVERSRKHVQDLLTGEDPEKLTDARNELADFGDSMKPEHDKVDEHLQTVLDGITNELRELAGSDDFAAVSSAIDKYEAVREDVSHAFSMQLITLQQRRDELVDDAKAALRKLKLDKDPKLLLEGIEQYPEFGQALSVEKEALHDRLHALVGGAVAEIHECLKSSNIAEIGAVAEKYQGWPQGVSEPLQALMAKQETAIVSADKTIRAALSSDDIAHINELLGEYLDSEKFVPDAYGALVSRQQDLEDDMREKLKDAAAPESQDPRAIEAVLLEAQQFGSGVQEDREALETWLATVLDKFVAEMEDLTQSQDFTVVCTTIDKFAGYPPPLEAPWQKLVQHRSDMLDVAKAKLAELCYVETPMEITQALAQFAAFGDHVVEARTAVLSAYSNLIDAARSEIDMWLDRPDATIAGMSDVIFKYADYPEEVDRIRTRLEKKRNSAVRVAEKRLAAAVTSTSSSDVSALMDEFESARAFLSGPLEKLEARRSVLASEAAEQLRAASEGECDPAAILKVIADADDLGDLVRADLDMARERYNAVAQQAVDDLLSMVGADGQDFAAIEEMLQRYAEYPDEVRVHWEKLLQHRNLLVRTARLHLQELAATSTDHSAIMQALDQHNHYGELLDGERQALDSLLVKLSDDAVAEIMRAVNHKATPLEKLEALQAQFADYPDYVERARSQLGQRVESLRGLKSRLHVIRTTCHPHDITSELERYAEYGDAIMGERELLQLRFNELVATAREELQALVDARMDVKFERVDAEVRSGDGTPQPPRPRLDIQTIESALDRYRRFPQVTDLHAALQIKYERLIQATVLQLTRLLSSDDVAEIDQALAGCQQSGHALSAPLMALQRRRIDLCDQMAAHMRAVSASTNPSDIEQALARAEPFGADLQNERRMLSDRLGLSLRQAEAEIATVIQSENAADIDDILEKYARYPQSLQDGALADIRLHKEELRRTMISKVEAAMGTEDLHTIDTLLRSIEDQFGEDMVPYADMLHARREKLRGVTVVRMQQALESDNLVFIDKVFENSMPLVEQIDEEIWNSLRQHREAVVKGLRGRVREVLSGSRLDMLDQLLGSVETCKHEMAEEFAELQEHRAYLLEEASVVAAESKHTFTPATLGKMGYKALAANLAHLKSFGEHVGDELERLQVLQSDMIADAKAALQQLLQTPVQNMDVAKVVAAIEKYTDYGAVLQHELQELEIIRSRIGERCQQKLGAIIAVRVQMQQEHVDGAVLAVATELPTPNLMAEILAQAVHFQSLASDVQRVREFKLQLVSEAKQIMHRVMEDADPPLADIQRIVRRYRGYSDETLPLWGQVHARYVKTLSDARSEILRALSDDDLHQVSSVLRRYGAAAHEEPVLPRQGQAEAPSAPAELGSVRDIVKDIESLEDHYRQLAKAEQQVLLEMMRSDDIVRIHNNLVAHTAHEHPMLQREVGALRRRLRKLEANTRSKLAAIARGVNVIEMEQALRHYGPLARETEWSLSAELKVLQERRAALLDRNGGRGANRSDGAEADARGRAQASALSSPLARGLATDDGSAARGGLEEMGGHAAAVVAAREHLSQMLGSDDLVAIDAAVQRYEYLGPAVGELLQRLKTRRVVVAAMPRGKQYTSLVQNSERLAELELSNRGLRERLRAEQSASGDMEAKLQAEVAATADAEQQIQAMRRQLVQRTRVARINTASAPPPGGAPGGRKRCPVCKGMFDATVWKAHSLECVDSIVRFSVAKSTTAAVAAAPR